MNASAENALPYKTSMLIDYGALDKFICEVYKCDQLIGMFKVGLKSGLRREDGFAIIDYEEIEDCFNKLGSTCIKSKCKTVEGILLIDEAPIEGCYSFVMLKPEDTVERRPIYDSKEPKIGDQVFLRFIETGDFIMRCGHHEGELRVTVLEPPPLIPFTPDPEYPLSFLNDPNLSIDKTIYLTEMGFEKSDYFRRKEIEKVEMTLRDKIEIHMEVRTKLDIKPLSAES